LLILTAWVQWLIKMIGKMFVKAVLNSGQVAKPYLLKICRCLHFCCLYVCSLALVCGFYMYLFWCCVLNVITLSACCEDFLELYRFTEVIKSTIEVWLKSFTHKWKLVMNVTFLWVMWYYNLKWRLLYYNLEWRLQAPRVI